MAAQWRILYSWIGSFVQSANPLLTQPPPGMFEICIDTTKITDRITVHEHRVSHHEKYGTEIVLQFNLFVHDTYYSKIGAVFSPLI